MKTFTIVIPTYNRPEALERCLNAILQSKLVAQEVLVIDDGELSEEFVQKWRAKVASWGSRMVYTKKDHEKIRRGLSESKNLALTLVSTPVFFMLDDDCVPEPESFSASMHTWENMHDEKLIAVGGVITNNRKKGIFEKIFNKIFLLTTRAAWDVTKAGYQVWDDFVPSFSKGHYAHGGASSYALSHTKEFEFTTFSGGRTGLEDVDFCLRTKQEGFYTIINPEARIAHYHEGNGRETDYQTGFKESVNRRLIFRTQCSQKFGNKLRFFWSSVGWVLRQILARHFSKAYGMIAGFIF